MTKTGCETCGYVGGLSMMACGKHCRPCHIYCDCSASYPEVMEMREKLKDVPGYAGTLYDLRGEL